MSFRVAIPSYKRAAMLSKKTLSFLAEQTINPELIDIFVANEEERAIYETTLAIGSYANLIVGHPGIARQRQFIQEYYPLGQHVFSIDDDIRGILTLRPSFSLAQFIEEMFILATHEKVNFWGIYPAGSLLYLKDQHRKGCLYIVACFYGFINLKDMAYPPLDTKEDWWASLERTRIDGAVLRAEFIAPKTTYWLKNGGLSETRTVELEKVHSDMVCHLFPQFTEGTYLRRNGHPDVKIKKLPVQIITTVAINGILTQQREFRSRWRNKCRCSHCS